MDRDQIQAEIDGIRAARSEKGGRMSNAEIAQIQHLEAMLSIPAEEGAEAEQPAPPVEAPTAPVAPSVGNARILSRNLTVPTPEGNRNYPEGTVVSVPEDFLARMIEADKLEPV